jgi:hypothetical protein
MKAGKIKSLIIAVFGCFYALCAHSAVSLFSDYGQIQNVQNYSTNPFWSPNSPYNQRMPQPVYVQGNNTTTDECIKILQSAVAFQCSARNNCVNTALSDIRPAIIVQLSNLPGKAYGTACAGYLDTVFESYVAQFGNYAPTKQVAFPSGSNVPNPAINNNDNTIQIKNPYEIKTPQWQQDIDERSRELKELQAENGTDYTDYLAFEDRLSATAFPTTYKDLSLKKRIENEAEDYAKYKKSAYQTINVKNAYDWCKEHPGSKECKEYEESQNRTAENNKTNNQSQQNKPTQTTTTKKPTNKEQRADAAEIVKLLQPANKDQEFFFTSLAADYVDEKSKNASLILDNQFLYDFFSSNSNVDRINTFKAGLQNLESKQPTKAPNIDIDWQEAVTKISTLLDDNKKLYGAMVCENNRSYEVGIEAALWTITAAAAVATFYAGGAGGAGTAAAGTAAKVGIKTLAKAALKHAVKTGLKWAILAAAGAIIIQTKGSWNYLKTDVNKTSFAKSSAGLLYSLVDSEPRTDIVNCQGLDVADRKKCYSVCGYPGAPNDELNEKVLSKVMGTRYCVSAEDFTLYDINTRKPLMMTSEQYKQVIDKLALIKDKGGCDWNEDDVDMFTGRYIYDPNTMEPSSYLLIEKVDRLDD